MDQLREAFLDPPVSFRPQPFWFLNLDCDHDLLRVQIAEMADKGVGGAVLHPRHGLKIPFMSPAWLDAMQVCIDEMAAHGMEAWLYDEDNWPSANFGGRLTRRFPENRMRYLRVQRLFVSGGATYRADLQGNGNTLITALACRYQTTDDGGLAPQGQYTEISRAISSDGSFKWAAPPGDWLVTVFWECPVAEKVTWFRGYYTDTMNPATMRKFVDSCYEPNLRFEAHFGKTVKGVFTDEPGLMIHDAYVADEALRGTVENPHRRLPGMTLPWTREFFDRFQRLKGYDLRPRLMDLVYQVSDDYRKVRCDFFDAVASWYVEAYHQQLSSWCHQHNLEYIGHTLEDPLFAQVRTQGNQTRVLEQMDRPGLDYLGHGVGTREAPHRILASKCAASVAHVMGRPRVMTEAFGGSGHGHRLSDRRVDLNFMAALGVNMVIPHAFYYSFLGLRKTDWPPCEFYHAPWWPWYKKWADYIGRVCLVQTQGHHVSGVAILSPARTIAVNMVRDGHIHRDSPQDRFFAELSDRLLRLHYDFDFLDEGEIERAQVAEGSLAFQNSDETYRVVILPAFELISRFAAEKLLAFFRAGGHLLAVGSLPLESDRRGDDEHVRDLMAEIFKTGDEKRMEGESEAGGRALFVADPGDVQAWLAEVLPPLLDPDVILEAENRAVAEDVVCSHRTEGRVHTFFIVNRSKDEPADVTWRGPIGLTGRLEEWDLETGTARELPVRVASDRVSMNLHFGGSEARLLVLDTESEPAVHPLPVSGRDVGAIDLSDVWRFEPQGPNVLVLDRFEFVARDTGLAAKIGPHGLGQLNSYTTTFVAQGKFEGLRLILDDLAPDLPSHVGFLSGMRNLEILLNGELLPAPTLASWMDPYLLEIPIDDRVHTGENVLQICMISLLEEMPRIFEPIYLIGDFQVQDRTIRPARGSMAGPWSDAGYPNYSGIAAYSQTVDIPDKYALGAKLILELDEVHDCCRVLVNGEEVEIRMWEPWSADISDHVKPGRNEITVEVANSATNLYDKNPRTSGLAGSARILIRER